MHSKIKQIKLLFLLCIVFAVTLFLFCGCSDNVPTDKNKVTVTLLNGEHYSVVGKNSVDVGEDGSVQFDVELERGYRIIGATGATVDFGDDVSFSQTVRLDNVGYKTVVRLETEPLETFAFSIEVKNGIDCDVTVRSVLGEAEEGRYYSGDILQIGVEAADGYKFICWSVDDLITNGGSFYSAEKVLDEFDFTSIAKLYANFRNETDLGNTVFYRFSDVFELEQDCTALLAHHARANTYTAAEIEAFGVDFEDKALVGWRDENGERVGLGSRVTVNADAPTVLYPDWKEYSPETEFTLDRGTLISYHGTVPESGEIVIPKTVGGVNVTSIAAKAFEGCSASVYYIPDTVEAISDNAFLNCTALTALYMSDNVMNIDDKAFSGCVNFSKLYLNAVLAPRRADYNSVKSEVYDRMTVNADNGKRKLVILAGSSARYGYCSTLIQDMFKEEGEGDIDVYNLGCAANMGGYCQYEMVLGQLREGDLFLHAPENWGFSWCGNLSRSVMTGEDAFLVNFRIFHVTEANWDLLSRITVNKYNNVFKEFCAFNKARATLNPKKYTDYYRTVGDNAYGFRYSTEGAFKENGQDKSFGNDGKRHFEDELGRYMELTRDSMYAVLAEKKVNVYVSFAPINRHNLLVTYNDEDAIKTGADKYTDSVKSVMAESAATVLLSQYDTVYDGRFFYDSDYHLGEPFRNTHTRNVISALISDIKQGGGGIDHVRFCTTFHSDYRSAFGSGATSCYRREVCS